MCDFCNALKLFLDGHLGCCKFLANRGTTLKSPIVKRSIVIAGHKTSISPILEGLKEIAGERHISSSDLVAAIDSDRQHGNLSSAIRLFVLDFHRAQRSEERRSGAHEMIGDTARGYP